MGVYGLKNPRSLGLWPRSTAGEPSPGSGSDCAWLRPAVSARRSPTSARPPAPWLGQPRSRTDGCPKRRSFPPAASARGERAHCACGPEEDGARSPRQVHKAASAVWDAGNRRRGRAHSSAVTRTAASQAQPDGSLVPGESRRASKEQVGRSRLTGSCSGTRSPRHAHFRSQLFKHQISQNCVCAGERRGVPTIDAGKRKVANWPQGPLLPHTHGLGVPSSPSSALVLY